MRLALMRPTKSSVMHRASGVTPSSGAMTTRDPEDLKSTQARCKLDRPRVVGEACLLSRSTKRSTGRSPL